MTPVPPSTPETGDAGGQTGTGESAEAVVPGAGAPGTRRGLPWQGRPQRADLICWFGIMAGGLYYLALIPLKPLLIGRDPLLLETLDGSMASIVTAGAFARVGKLPLLLALLAPVPATMMLDPFYWWAGRRWGRAIIELFAGRGRRSTRVLARGERLFARFGAPAVVLAYVLPIPASLTYALAGWSGMRLRTFVALDLAGTLLWTGLLAGLGYGLGASAVRVAQAVSDYGTYLSLGLVVVIVAVQVSRARRARATAPPRG